MKGNGTPLSKQLVWRRLHRSKTQAPNPNVLRVTARTGSAKDTAQGEKIAISIIEKKFVVQEKGEEKDADADAVTDAAVETNALDRSKVTIHRIDPGRHL